MRALVFDRKGIESLNAREVDPPLLGEEEVLIDVEMAGVNPVDRFTVTGMRDLTPMPHIPGSEYAGTISKVGSGVTGFEVGDRVTVYNRVYDGSCKMCHSGMEMLCKHGGIMGIANNGGYAEQVAVSARNVERLPEGVSWEVAASLPIAALTPYHALDRAELVQGESLAVFGASGNTGMFAVQLGKRKGAKVYAISSKSWVKELGADRVLSASEASEALRKATDGAYADVVLNSIGEKVWAVSLDALGVNGRLVFFGALTGSNVSLPLGTLYGKQQKIIGSTGGKRMEFRELVGISKELRVKVWKVFSLEDASEALRSLDSPEREGRIMLKP